MQNLRLRSAVIIITYSFLSAVVHINIDDWIHLVSSRLSIVQHCHQRVGKQSFFRFKHAYIIYTYWIDSQLQNTYNLFLKFWINKKHVKQKHLVSFIIMQTQVRVAFVLLLILRFNILAPYLCITQRILIYFERLNFTTNFYLLFY